MNTHFSNVVKIGVFLLYGFFVSIRLAFSQSRYTISGTVKDSLRNTPLGFASVKVISKAIGSTTDQAGTFRLLNVPEGELTLRISYVGYKPKVISVKLKNDIEIDILMNETTYSTDEVVISAQLEGQRAAIQQQINSNTIVNVVSQDKILSLPDQNAAETVGRISGVAVQRDGGEATKVVVRGLAPKFTSVTINGERIPATDGEDRSVDLSMVSIDAIGGIEVFKALTPDRDGDAIGGTVNFVVKQASEEFKGNVRIQTGYNRLAREFWQNRGAFNLSNRFFDSRIGIVLTGNYQRANRSFHELQSDFESRGSNADGTVDLILANLNLTANNEVRERYGGSLTLDYNLPKGSIVFNSLLGVLDREQTRYRRRFRPSTSRQEYEVRDQIRSTLTLSNTLSASYSLGKLEMSGRASYSLTDNDVDFDHTSRFREDGAFTGNLNETFIDSVVLAARNDLNRTRFQQDRLDQSFIFQRNYTAQIDLAHPLKWGKWLLGSVKTGIKLRDQQRSRDGSRIWTAFSAINDITDAFPDEFELNDEGQITISQYFGSFQPVDYLSGDWPFSFGRTLDAGRLNDFAEQYQESFYSEDERLRLQNYEAEEQIRAAYFMTTLTLFKKWTFLPGVRVEQTITDYLGLFGRSFEQEGRTQISARDTLGGQDYTEWLPMFHVKYQMKPWMDIRLAATRTLSRPDFFDLVPWQEINDIERILQRGNPTLLHTKVWNYDLMFSFYNATGLFTIGGFYKRLQDVSAQRFSRFQEEGPTQGYQLIEPINLSSDPSTVWGVEFDLQGNLQKLPAPLDGIVFGLNFTIIRSETFIPLTLVSFDPTFQPIFTDTVRSGSLPDQPNQILNVSLGYEKKGFSGRIAYYRQDNSLLAIGPTRQEDLTNIGFDRLDITLKQKIWKELSMFINANNLTNQRERAVSQGRFDIFGNTRDAWTRNRIYGWTMDIGVNWKF